MMYEKYTLFARASAGAPPDCCEMLVVVNTQKYIHLTQNVETVNMKLELTHISCLLSDLHGQ